MNIIAGMIDAGDELGAEAGPEQLVVLGRRRLASTSRRRPNTLTSSWPVNASSIWALSAPVCVHWAMNCRCDRLAICRVTTMDSGIATSAISVSSGEMTTIITSTPITVSSEVSSWLSVCCRLCATLSMSLVTRLSSSPRGWLSKYGSGRRLSLSSTSARSCRIADCTTPVSR